MNRSGRLALAAATAAAVITAVSIVATAARAETNVIGNPGFESGLAGWSCGATGSAVAGHARSGTHALAGAANNSDNARCTQTVAVTG